MIGILIIFIPLSFRFVGQNARWLLESGEYLEMCVWSRIEVRFNYYMIYRNIIQTTQYWFERTEGILEKI